MFSFNKLQSLSPRCGCDADVHPTKKRNIVTNSKDLAKCYLCENGRYDTRASFTGHLRTKHPELFGNSVVNTWLLDSCTNETISSRTRILAELRNR